MKNYLSVEDLATETGESVSVWRKRVSRQIGHIKTGRNVRIALDFDHYIELRFVPPNHLQPAASMHAGLQTALRWEAPDE